jgi:hypothetical protein
MGLSYSDGHLTGWRIDENKLSYKWCIPQDYRQVEVRLWKDRGIGWSREQAGDSEADLNTSDIFHYLAALARSLPDAYQGQMDLWTHQMPQTLLLLWARDGKVSSSTCGNQRCLSRRLGVNRLSKLYILLCSHSANHSLYSSIFR